MNSDRSLNKAGEANKTTPMSLMHAESNLGSKVNVDDISNVVNFLVLDMAGNSRIYPAVSIKDLRIQLAIQARVFYPCIELFKRSTYALLTNAHEITQIFNSETEPYEIYVVNNEEGVKREVGAWDGSKWIDVLGGYIEQGDHGLLARARLVDSMVDGKMRLTLKEIASRPTSTPLYFPRPCQIEAVKIIKTAITLGVNVREDNLRADSFFFFVAAMADHDLLRILVEQGFDINAAADEVDDRRTALTRAIVWNEANATLALIRAGADPNLRGARFYFWSPLHWAIGTRSVDMVTLLIDSRAAINDTRTVVIDEDVPAHTPLHLASLIDCADVIRVLMRSGADVNAKDLWGRTPYDVAINDTCRELILNP